MRFHALLAAALAVSLAGCGRSLPSSLGSAGNPDPASTGAVTAPTDSLSGGPVSADAYKKRGGTTSPTPTPTGAVSVRDLGAKGDGITDDSSAIRKAVASLAGTSTKLFFPNGTYLVSQDGSNNWAINLPANTTLEFEQGAVLKLKPYQGAWTRVLTIQNVHNVNLLGYLEIDAQGSLQGTGSEHMHGLFIYDAQDIFIDTVYSHDARGDNVSLSGSGENAGSQRVTINKIIARKAGRKNLVIEAVNELHILNASLDNTQGGYPNWAGENSLDFEPFGFTESGTTSFNARLDYVETTGYGNDFTIGTTQAMANRFKLSFGTLIVNAVNTPSTQPVMLSYGANVSVEKLQIRASGSTVPQHLFYTQYAANWNVTDATLELQGASGNPVLKETAQAADQKGKLNFGTLRINAPYAPGVEVWGADLHADNLQTTTGGGHALYVFSTRSDSSVTVGALSSTNSGKPGSDVVRTDSYNGNAQQVGIQQMTASDNRLNKAAMAVLVGAGMEKATTLGSVTAPDLASSITYASSNY